MSDGCGSGIVTIGQSPVQSDNAETAKKFLQDTFKNKKIGKVLLITPPDADKSIFQYPYAKRQRYSNYPPYGLAVLTSRLRLIGIEVEICNLNHEVLKTCSLSKSEEDFDFTSVWQTKLASTIERYQPDFVCVTCMFTMTHDSLKDVCAFLEKYDIPLALGGVHVSNDADRVLNEIPSVKFAFVREGDISLPLFIQAVNGGSEIEELGQTIFNTPGQRIRFEKEVQPTAEDLNRLPAFDLTPDIGEYSRYGMVGSFYWFRGAETKAATVLSNRGCRARCTFCSVRNFNGGGVRQRSIESVVDELQLLQDTYGIEHIMWLDDDLLKDEVRIIGLFNEMVRRNLRLTWDATNGVIAAAITAELIAAAAESGCIGLNIGMESGNPEILRRVRKPGKVENFLEAARLVRKYEQIVASVFLIIGFPGETMSQILDTINVAREMDLDWARTQMLQPLPNTPIYDEMVQQGLIDPEKHKGRFTVGSYGKIASVDKKGRLLDDNAREAFSSIPLDAVPTEEQLNDIWFYMDYHLNYNRLFNETRPVKIKQQMQMLRRVCDVNSPDNGFALYFLGQLQAKLQGSIEADIIRRLENECKVSTYWLNRLHDFGLAPEDLNSLHPAKPKDWAAESLV